MTSIGFTLLLTKLHVHYDKQKFTNAEGFGTNNRTWRRFLPVRKSNTSPLDTVLLSLLAAGVLFGGASLFFDIVAPRPNMTTAEASSTEDIKRCTALGYTKNSYYFHKCLDERMIYNRCLAENEEKLKFFEDSGQTLCENEANGRFPTHISEFDEFDVLLSYIPDGESPVDTPSPTNVIPDESFSIQIADTPQYTEESLKELRETFVKLCVEEWKHEQAFVPKLLPDCKYKLDISA
jgi:hypothetical protein